MELVNIQYAGEGVQPIDLSPKDKALVTSNFINSAFGAPNDYLELYIYDQNGTLLDNDYDGSDYYPFITNNPKNNTYSNLILDPEKDLKNRGFVRGNLNIQYNFYTKLFNSSFGKFYWIKEISTSRTELKLASQVLSDISIKNGFDAYQSYIVAKNYYPVFYLNFGNNQTVVANNVAYTEDGEGAYLLVKLYEPLPTSYDLKTQLWIVDKVAESVSFNVSIEVQADETQQLNSLRGPNYNVVLNTKNGQTTPYYNYNNLLVSDVSSSYQKLKSYYQDKAIQINVDYSNFANFVHFSSAVERVNNFVYKLQLIESASATITEQQSIIGNSTVVNSTITAEQHSINNIIKNFDIYEYFLYFESSSWAWPKSTTTQPYALYSVSSSEASNFLGSVNTLPTPTTQSLLWSASYYDATNKDLLHNSVPQYLLDDPSNQPYITFVDMIGQHFDNIWIYYKDVTNRFNATNNPNTGISLEMVSDALKGLGFNLYTNTNVSDNLYYTLFGINPDGSLLPPTGSEWITNYVTSSLTTLPAETIQDEMYKRLYHNLPYLLKSKGTLRGVKALISTFGIPESILTVREFGGNFTGSLDGIIDLNSSDYKVTIATGSGGNVTGGLTISSSLLSPYTTIQYYQGNTRLNNTNVEVGFSPADVINTNITASLGTFSLDQLIGSPGYQYSASYQPLVSASNAYFASYTQPNSVWEYIRLLKFYNNSLFKTIKDFIPARANISTGIIIKSHMLERNKYARHEPQITFNDYSQSIDMLTISGSEGGALTDSTEWSATLVTPIGTVPFTSSTGVEKYNGELGGSEIVATSGLPFPQYLTSKEYIFLGTKDGSYLVTQNYDYLVKSKIPVDAGMIIPGTYQNIENSVRSLFLLDLDYNSNQLKPVNYTAVTYSIDASQINNYDTYTNPNNPYAEVQDYNYYLQRSIVPRYDGSKTISATYNTYTPGDQSYGKTAAIDKIKYQYAYLVDIYSASFYFPGRSNAQIKYIIDNNQNVLDLTKANKNLFTVQNVFKGGETSNVSLFDYDENNPYIQQLVNDLDINIYEGGYRYLPILHNLSGSSNIPLIYDLNEPIETRIQVTSEGSSLPPGSPYLSASNYSVNLWVEEVYIGGPSELSNFAFYVSASYVGPSAPPTQTIYLNISPKLKSDGTCGSTSTVSVTVSSGQIEGSTPIFIVYNLPYVNKSGGGGWSTYSSSPNHWPDGYSNCTPTINSVTAGGGGGGGGSTEQIIYKTELTSYQPCLYLLSQSNEIIFDASMSYYINTNGLTFKSTSDTAFAGSGLSPVIVPFTLSPGDKISFYDFSSSLCWNQKNEYTVKSVRISGSYETTTSSILLAQLSELANLALFQSSSATPREPITGAPWKACRYIVWKHIPDETNIILNYNPKDPSIVENGLLFPEYIDPPVRENSGNVVKALKQQNLI